MRKFKCKECQCSQEVSFWKYVFHMHIGKKVYVKCPKCNKYNWHVKEENNGSK